MTPGRLPSPRVLLLIILAAALSGCSGPTRVPPPVVDRGPYVLVGAGDIAVCGSEGSVKTANLIDGIPGTVFTAGDNVYMMGTAAEYRDCYEPTWGRHRSRTRPTAGNHDYATNSGAPYYDYFGESAGPRGLGYYSYILGDWRIIALNSEIDHRPGSQQLNWLRDELAANAYHCTAAIWHKPMFTSGPNGPNPSTRDFWRVLYDAGADLILNGHDHLYERFAPQDPEGRPDEARGIRQITVGTGGATPYFFGPARSNSVARLTGWGVLVLRLDTGTYQWDFVPVAGSGPGQTDTGNGQCH